MHYVYVLQSEHDGNLYVGCTADIDRRFEEHCRGQVPSTKYRLPVTLIYQEEFIDPTEAFSRERYFKTATGKRHLKEHLKLPFHRKA